MNYTAYGCYLHNNKKDLCYVTFPLNSGPGCGSVINGKLIEGENSIAGEILYLPFFKYLNKNSYALIIHQKMWLYHYVV